MADFVKLSATAKRLIEKNGRTVTIGKLSATPADSSKPWRGTTAEIASGSKFEAKMAFVPPSGGGFGRMVKAVENLNERLSQIGLLASDSLPSSITPAVMETMDFVLDGTQVFRIITREHLKPATKSVIFALALAQAGEAEA